ncbi:Smg-4/UPF3 family-domain-containing protein [Flagelloscypha sp. PMI_526]|nr:Smg-4/UPF3 family-domain-containing protein [Flagelloscypha sp. PMI_526]
MAKVAQPPRLKTVVRRLPPNLPEHIFWQSVSPWVSDDTITWKIFYPGKVHKRPNKEDVPSRANIAFKSEELLTSFSRDYDGHLFRDSAGNESYAVVEFAPYQKIPSKNRKPDARSGTIFEDADFLSFINSLDSSNAVKEPLAMDKLLESLRPASPPKTTPLLEALKADKQAAKDKQAILANHAHHKDSAISIHKKEAHKKKADKDAEGKKGDQTPAPSKKAAKRAAAAAKAAAGSNQPQPPVAPKANKSKGPKAPRPDIQTPTIITNPRNSVVQAPDSNATTSPAGPQATPTARRGRPVFGGLGTRQFEAALSGAGVTNAPRTRREKPPSVAEGSKATDADHKVSSPAAPKPPGILPRIDTAPPHTGGSSGSSGRGRGRGRGGGRGRGRGGMQGGRGT